MLNFLKKKEVIANEKQPTQSNDVMRLFQIRYAPYLVKGYKIPNLDINNLKLSKLEAEKYGSLALAIDIKRDKEPFIGATIAGKEILYNLTETLKTEKGVHAETLIAILGALGGYECMRGVVTSLEGFSYAELAAIDTFIVEEGGKKTYILGDLIGNEFKTFFINSLGGNMENNEAINFLLPISKYCAERVSKPEFWQTPYNELIGQNPLELSDIFKNFFEKTFTLYTRFPYERVASYAFAARSAIKQVSSVLDTNKAMSILAEYGWRTSHYIL